MSLVDDLLWLVDMPSVTGEEQLLCTALARRLSPRFGADAIVRIGNGLVVGIPDGRPQISLYGHLDTVPVQGNLPARLEEGRVYGLGASDMKSGLAVMLHLLEDEAVRSGPYSVTAVFYDREEGPADDNGLEDVLQAVGWLADAEFAVVMEPSDLELQLGCQGALNATVRFAGESAHSARPWLGENAITKAGAWLDRMHRRAPDSLVVSGLEFREVFSVTTASGGVARNVIPASFEVNLNYRFPPGLSLEDAERRLLEVAAEADSIEVTDRAPGGPVPEGNPHLERLEQLSGAARTAKQGWTDVARLAQRGIPAVNYGPGETSLAHRADESVPVRNLEIVHRALQAFLTT